MRNLKNTRHDRLRLGTGRSITAQAWDATDDSLVVATGPTETDSNITLNRISNSSSSSATSSTLIASWNASAPSPDLRQDYILDLHCLAGTGTIILVLAGGDIVSVREDVSQDANSSTEIVGSVDSGLLAASWSPDEELIVLSTRADSLLLMTCDFDVLADIALSTKDASLSDNVSVGWGKKKTQFKGRGVAKTLRDPTVPEVIDEGTLSISDRGQVNISWRGDGQYFAVNSIVNVHPRRRLIRVYSREGVLESASEPVNGLGGALSWKPSGQLIAGVQTLEEKINVVFFERNGLRHGEFSLRLDKQEISTIGENIDLMWNIDSTILAVILQDRAQLWTMGNYHYYLKQEILFYSTGASPVRFQWHPEKARHLCVSRSGDIRRLSYNFEVCRGSLEAPSDLGLVAVIDGALLKVTPLRIANIPPPMACDELALPANALDVAISEDGRRLVVLHANKTATIWQCDYAAKPIRKATLEATVETESFSPDNSPWSFPTGIDSIINRRPLAAAKEDSGDSTPVQIDYSDAEHVIWTDDTGIRISFRLRDNGSLHIESDHQSKINIPGCTSFVITSHYLIYTTAQHFLKFVHLHNGMLEIPENDPAQDERCRSIERGARIVTVMPSAYALVLQMPRGNLETIYPRALVLAGIRHSIQLRKYKKAFKICRAQRVDMNILHDYRPDQFIADVQLWVKQLEKTEYIDLLLSSLSEQDVSKTIYRETAAVAEHQKANGSSTGEDTADLHTGGSKVNRICDAFLRVLEQDPVARLQSIVTAHVSKNPPDLENGLRLISNLRKSGDQIRLEQAVNHICFLADVNQLYDTALGLYDLEVALLVAQESQKDPREYLPYLQSLHNMDELRKCFAIDNDLKRYSKALLHMHAMDEFEELKSYMEKHELYSIAIELYRYDDARLSEIMRLYAVHLSGRNQFREAGIAFEYISDHASAYEPYRSAGLWRECLSNAAAVPLEPEDLKALASDLANSAEETKDFEGAATIHSDTLQDVEAAARLWCKGFMFAEAIRQITQKQRPDLLRTVVDAGLIESSATMTEFLAEMKSQLAAQVPRLQELRKKKLEDPMSFMDGGDAADMDIPDNLSLAPTDATTSAGTFLTRYTQNSTGTLATNATRRTSKNRRREERKRARGKKGTFYEEDYLVNSIARLIERLNATAEDISRLVDALTRRKMRERAVAVQTAAEEVFKACSECVPQVFAKVEVQSAPRSELLVDEARARPFGGQGVLFDALNAPRREPPILKAFERLSLV